MSMVLTRRVLVAGEQTAGCAGGQRSDRCEGKDVFQKGKI